MNVRGECLGPMQAPYQLRVVTQRHVEVLTAHGSSGELHTRSGGGVHSRGRGWQVIDVEHRLRQQLPQQLGRALEAQRLL
jgi:hypothetical protein